MPSSHTQKNHFELLGILPRFAIDAHLLEQNYRKLQSEVHPDRFVTAPTSDRLHSMQLATEVNEAYRTLKNPTARARYLLQIKGVDTEEESNTAMPADFLMHQMEWREAIEDARKASDITALEQLAEELNGQTNDLIEDLRINLDETGADDKTAETVRKLSFVDKVRSDIAHAITLLED